MSKVLIGIAAAIVLAAAVFAIVHLSHGPKSIAATTPQSRWVAVTSAAKKERGPMHLAGTFGSWTLMCRDVAPGKSHCVISLLMRNLTTPKQFLNLRFQNSPDGSGAIAMIAYAHGHTGETYVAGPGSTEEVDIKTDGATDRLWILRCFKGVCFTLSPLTQAGVDTLLAAHSLSVKLAATKTAKADEVPLPVEGLSAAFAALRRQPA